MSLNQGDIIGKFTILYKDGKIKSGNITYTVICNICRKVLYKKSKRDLIKASLPNNCRSHNPECVLDEPPLNGRIKIIKYNGVNKVKRASLYDAICVKCLYKFKNYTYYQLFELSKIDNCNHEQRKKILKYRWENKNIRSIYYHMMERCYSEKSKYYYLYGGRGIVVCEEWLTNPPSFEKWATEHGYHEGLEIDRIDSDGIYCPENCRFISKRENGVRRKCVYHIAITDRVGNIYEGTLYEWATRFNKYKKSLYEYMVRYGNEECLNRFIDLAHRNGLYPYRSILYKGDIYIDPIILCEVFDDSIGKDPLENIIDNKLVLDRGISW